MPEIRNCARCHNPMPEGRRSRMHAECVRAYRAELAARPATAVRTRGTAANVPARRFGVEIEFNCIASFDAVVSALVAAGIPTTDQGYTHNGVSSTGWTLKRDGSLGRYGKELVSPPLSGAEGFEALKTACAVLRTLGARADRTTGLHIHHDVEDLNLRQFKNVVIGYANHQGAIDELVAASRRGHQTYCGRLGAAELTEIRNCPSLGRIARFSPNRYVNVNLQAFEKYGTLEFRQHQGSVNFTKIAAWISFGQAFIAKAKADAEAGMLYEVAGFSYDARPATVRCAELIASLTMPAARRRQLMSRIGDVSAAAA